MSCNCGTTTNIANKSCSNQEQDYCTCLGFQIEQLKKRTDELKQQIECLNPNEAYNDLTPVQTCVSPNGGVNTGTSCDGSPTGSAVGSCCGSDNPANTQDFCYDLAKKIRELEKIAVSVQADLCSLQDKGLRTVLLDSSGNARGALTLNGNVVSLVNGSWEQAIA